MYHTHSIACLYSPTVYECLQSYNNNIRTECQLYRDMANTMQVQAGELEEHMKHIKADFNRLIEERGAFEKGYKQVPSGA